MAGRRSVSAFSAVRGLNDGSVRHGRFKQSARMYFMSGRTSPGVTKYTGVKPSLFFESTKFGNKKTKSSRNWRKPSPRWRFQSKPSWIESWWKEILSPRPKRAA